MKNGIVNKAKMRRRLFAPLVAVAMLVAAKHIPVEWVKIVLYVGAFLLVVRAAFGFYINCPLCNTPFVLRMGALFGKDVPLCPHCGMTYRVE